MKPIDGDVLLSSMYQKLISAKIEGSSPEVVVRWKDLVLAIKLQSELQVVETAAVPARKQKDYNGYTTCSKCGSRLPAPTDPYCSSCGCKFIDKE